MRSTLLSLLLITSQLIFARQNCKLDYGAPVISFPVDSLQIAYTDIGRGPVLLFVHGIGENAGYWRQNLEPLSRKGFRCIAIDLPGSGYSSKPLADSINNHLDFLAGVVNRFATLMQLKKVTLIGNDFGGQVAGIIAEKKPDWLKQLVLVSPTGLETFTYEEAALLKTFYTSRYYRNQDAAVINKNIERQFFQMPSSASLLINQRIAMRKCPDFEAWTNSTALNQQAILVSPLLPRLKLLQLPVLLLTGDHDSIIPNQLLHSELSLKTLVDKAQVQIKKCTVKTITNAGHLLHWEQPAAFNEAINIFAKGRN